MTTRIVLHRSLDPERKMDMTKATHIDTQGDEYDKFYKDLPNRSSCNISIAKNCLCIRL